jgi:hypothetical protein
VCARFRLKQAIARDRIEKISKNFSMPFCGAARCDLSLARRARRMCKNLAIEGRLGLRCTKKPIFLDKNARREPRAIHSLRRFAKTCVAMAPSGGSEDRTRTVTCDDCRALKHDVNGLHKFFKSVG